MEVKKIAKEWEIWDEDRSGKFGRRGKEIGFRKVLQVDLCLWQEN